MCLAQGHNAAMPVKLEPGALWSRVKHPTTEQLRSLTHLLGLGFHQISICKQRD